MKIISWNDSKYFLDINYSINEELIKSNDFNSDENVLIITNAATYPKMFSDLKNEYKFDKLIVYNFEQLYDGSRFLSKSFLDLVKNADEVWDYDESNIEYFKSRNIRLDVKLHTLRQPKSFLIKNNNKVPEYDVLFVGSLNPRRKKILDELVKNGVNVLIPPKVFGDELSKYITNAKILLNIHAYDTCIQEQARLIRFINNGKIISEKSVNNYFNVHEVDYKDIVKTVLSELKK